MEPYIEYVINPKLPYILVVDGYVNVSDVDPLKHPVLKLYTYIENTNQYRVYSIVQCAALMNANGYIANIKPIIQVKQNMPKTHLFLLPWIHPHSKTNNDCYTLIQHEYDHRSFVIMQTLGKENSETIRWLLSRVVQYGTYGMLQLLKYNEYELTTVDKTIDDFNYFKTTYPQSIVPNKWFVVHALEVPYNSDLPLYPDGTVHISYMEVYQWILFQCEKNALILHTNYFNGIIIDLKLDEIDKQLTIATKRNRPSNMIEYDIEDMDQLLVQMAPCLLNLIGNGEHYPKNDERMQLVPILKAGGVPLETTIELYNKLHIVDPNGRDKTGVKRSNPTHDYKKEIFPSNCIKMGSCPYKHETNPKSLCIQEFNRRFPDIKPRKFSNPASWFHWINKKE